MKTQLQAVTEVLFYLYEMQFKLDIWLRGVYTCHQQKILWPVKWLVAWVPLCLVQKATEIYLFFLSQSSFPDPRKQGILGKEQEYDFPFHKEKRS